MAAPGWEDLLPLSPLQEGLLFHAEYDGADGDGAPDAYAVQLVVALTGPLDAAALRRAGDALLARHQTLRAGFRPGRSGRPVQLLARDVELPWREVDLAGVAPDERADRLAELAAAERTRRFDLASPPALRLVLVRLGAAEHRLVLTSHHILLDGWSTPLLVDELAALYAGDAAALPPVPAYREYLGWLLAQDADAARAAWDAALRGLERPTLLAAEWSRPDADLDATPVEIELTEEATADLTAAARRHGVTVNTVLQGAWAVLLGMLSGRADVTFGTTVAGRPADVPGVEHMIGLLINTVPVRIRLDADEALPDALARIQREQAGLMDHRHLGLAEIQRRAGLGELFDTLLVVENQPQPACGPIGGGVTITARTGTPRTTRSPSSRSRDPGCGSRCTTGPTRSPVPTSRHSAGGCTGCSPPSPKVRADRSGSGVRSRTPSGTGCSWSGRPAPATCPPALCPSSSPRRSRAPRGRPRSAPRGWS